MWAKTLDTGQLLVQKDSDMGWQRERRSPSAKALGHHAR
jgi:hypothetical protein